MPLDTEREKRYRIDVTSNANTPQKIMFANWLFANRDFFRVTKKGEDYAKFWRWFLFKKKKSGNYCTFYSLNFPRNYRHDSFNIGIRIKLRSMCLTTINSKTCFSQILSPQNRSSFQHARILMRFNIQRFYLREVLPKKISWRESVYKLEVPFQHANRCKKISK